jgi:hypothetical protein
MIKNYPGEKWKEITMAEGALRMRYAISSYGRIASFTESLKTEGQLLKGGLIGGYPSLPLRPFGKPKTLYIHKLVGEYFLAEYSEGKTHIIHLDYNKQNNHVDNLKWATKSEMVAHQQANPAVLEGREKKRARKTQKGHKLTSTQVLLIKKKIFDPNRKTRMKMIAKQFGISEMQLYRIKSGENWGHVKEEENRNTENKKGMEAQ